MKTTQEQKTITRQVSRKLEELRPMKTLTKGPPSWIDYIRKGLGMSLTQLARRVGVAQSTISGAIKSEEEKRISLQTLQDIANAMECDLVYAFVPRKKLEDTIMDQATKKTLALMKETELHMDLEDQRVQTDKKQRLKELSEERIYSKYLWDNE